MTGLMQEHGVEVVRCLVAHPDIVIGVQQDVAGPGAAIGLIGRPGRHHRGSQGLRRQANVPEASVALSEARNPEGLAAVGDKADVDVGVYHPGLKGAEDLHTPIPSRILAAQTLG